MTPGKRIIVLTCFAVLAAACTSSTSTESSEPAVSEESSASSVDGPGERAPAEGEEVVELSEEQRAELFPQLDTPPVSALEVTPAIASHGQEVSIRGLEGLAGEVSLIGADGAAQVATMAGGQATFTVAADLGAGPYLVEVNGTGGESAGGRLRVADGAGVWITADRRYARRGHPALITVEAYGLPDDAVAALSVEDRASGTSVLLAPTPNDTLAPVGFGDLPPLSAFVGRRLEVPDILAGSLQLLVARPGEEEPSTFSNQVRIGLCEEGGSIVGSMGGPGSVSALWIDGGLKSARAHGVNGSFELAAGPGRVMVTRTFDDDPGGAGEVVVVEVPCGGAADVDDPADRVSEQEEFPSLALDEYTLEASGDVEIRHVGGTAFCSVDDEELFVNLAEDSDDTGYSVSLIVDPYRGAGSYEAAIFVFSPEFTSASGFASLTVAVDGGVAEGQLEGQADGDLGAVDLTAAFRCSLGGDPGAGLNGEFLPVSWRASSNRMALAQGTGGGGEDTCRSAIVSADGDTQFLTRIADLAANEVAGAAPRIDVVTGTEQQNFAAFLARKQLVGADADTTAWAQTFNSDYLIHIAVMKAEVDVRHLFGEATREERYFVTYTTFDVPRARVIARAFSPNEGVEFEIDLLDLPGFDTVPEKLAEAGICGTAEPEHTSLEAGEKQNIEFKVTTLDGEEVSGAQVVMADPVDGEFSANCGSFDRTSGTTASPFETTFTAAEEPPEACSEYPRFVATWESPSGEVSTDPEREQADAQLDVESEWWFAMEVELPDETGLQDIIWSSVGSFVADDRGFISGEATGDFFAVRSCEVRENGVLTFKEEPTEMTATFDLQVHGSAGDDEMQLLFLGFGFDPDWPPFVPECHIVEDIVEGFIRIVAYQPDNLVRDGIRIMPTLGEKWIFIIDDGGTITIQLTEKPD